MKVRVILERIYEINADLEDLGFDSIEEVIGMEEIDVFEEESHTYTTWLKSAELLEDEES